MIKPALTAAAVVAVLGSASTSHATTTGPVTPSYVAGLCGKVVVGGATYAFQLSNPAAVVRFDYVMSAWLAVDAAHPLGHSVMIDTVNDLLAIGDSPNETQDVDCGTAMDGTRVGVTNGFRVLIQP